GPRDERGPAFSYTSVSYLDVHLSAGFLRLARLVSESHRVAKLPLTVLAILGRDGQHVLEHRHQLTLRWRNRRIGYLGLLPEDLPVRLARILDAIEFRLSRITTFVLGEEVSQLDVDRAHSGRVHRIVALKRRDLRLGEEE